MAFTCLCTQSGNHQGPSRNQGTAVETVTAGLELRPAARLRAPNPGGAESLDQEREATMAYVYGTTSSDILNADDGVTSGRDHVYGGDGHDTIHGLGGDDDLFGEDGRDTLFGGDGNDWLEGGRGKDELNGGDDNDFLWGQDGDDELNGGNNDDYLDGGIGADTARWRRRHRYRGLLRLAGGRARLAQPLPC